MLKENPTPLARLWMLLKPDSLDIRNIYIYAIFSGLVSLSLPLGIQAIVNLIQGGQISTSWIVLVVFVVFGVAASGVLQILQLRITETLQQKIFTRAAFEFAYRIPKIKFEQLYKQYAPELMNRFFDTISVQKGISKILIDFTAAGLQVVFGLILLSFYHPFFIVFSLILVLLIFTIFQFTAKQGLKTSIKESKYKYQVAYWLEEVARTASSFKLAGHSDLPLGRTNSNVNEYLDARESHFKILIKQYGLLLGFKIIVVTGLLAIGGILVIDGDMNIGQFIAAEIIILLVLSSVDKLIQSLETIYDVLTSLEKIGQVTDLEIESDQGIDAISEIKTDGITVELKNASFKYQDQSISSLTDVNLKVEAGEKVVVTGPNGSGKSTLLSLLAGIYAPINGNVLFCDIPFNNLALDSIRDLTGSYLDDETIFEGTVLENIALGRKSATLNNVQWAIEKLGLSDFIHHLPNGYNTRLSPQNEGLPDSMVQKILLARSIAIKPKLLLLGQPLNQIDYEERNRIIDFLVSHENKWTLIANSSSSYFAEKADKTLFLKAGEVQSFEKYKDSNSKNKLEDNAQHI